jgi:SAM-dependent methyltransferase
MGAPVRSDLDSAQGQDDWNSHWARFGSANERNPAQEYRRRVVLKLLERHGPPRRLLDIGSGTGELLAAAAARWPDAELLGLELSEAAVQIARAKVPTAGFRCIDLLQDPPPEDAEGWASHATCSEVLEHVDAPVTLLRNARRWLAPAGHVVITVPGGPMSAFDRHIGHRRHFSPPELVEVIGAAGLEPLWAAGAGYPFFNLYRALVIARGERLIADARSHGAGAAARAAMAVFGSLFRLNLPRSRFGWQTIALAREPE